MYLLKYIYIFTPADVICSISHTVKSAVQFYLEETCVVLHISTSVRYKDGLFYR